jgi:hypothetical protein
MNETTGTMDKLHAMQAGETAVFTHGEMRILKTLDRANEIRSMPHYEGRDTGNCRPDGERPDWLCWFEWQTINEVDLQQITGRLPQGGVRSGLERPTVGLDCGVPGKDETVGPTKPKKR